MAGIPDQIEEGIGGCPRGTDDIGGVTVCLPQTSNPHIQEVGMKITDEDDTGVVTGGGQDLHHRGHRSVDIEDTTMRVEEFELLELQ